MKTLNSRQLRILEFLKVSAPKSATEIENYLKGVSRATVNRDLELLLDENKIYKEGKGKNTEYFISKGYTYTKPYSIDYFYKNPAERDINPNYNQNITEELESIEIFSDEEVIRLEALTQKYRSNVKRLGTDVLKRELERVIIELSWMSSKIEGNTYSLIETELLIEKNKVAEGKTKAETQMILNHKDAIKYIVGNTEEFTKLTTIVVLKVHEVLIKDLESHGYRNSPVGITGTLYRPLQKKEKLQKELDKIVDLINKKVLPFEKSLLANLLIAYLQPFKDGNKRTARIVGNALLLANTCSPLSLLTLDEEEYRRALLLFYEQNNLSLFKKIFLDQYNFAVENYFLA
ncbi:Fic family protein [Patescibacteria group bacterium]|nr:Fic family protein [Patescibacteria group bacterium]